MDQTSQVVLAQDVWIAPGPELKPIALSAVVFDQAIYPRPDHDPALVQRYVEVIEQIEAASRYISVSADMRLLDGKHRWLAYRKLHENTDTEIMAWVYPVTSPHDQLRVAAKLNSDSAWQLSEESKDRTAKLLYSYGSTFNDIAYQLSIGTKKVSQYLSRIVKDQKVARNKRMFDLWLACYTQEEIADSVGVDHATVSRFVQSLSQEQMHKTDLANPLDEEGGDADDESKPSFFAKKAATPRANHKEDDFDVPLYNVWKQQTKTAGAKHFGNSEVRWLDNLLYLYTSPWDIVIDPFAGSGATVGLCKSRLRRYWVSDRKPIVEMERDIRKHDLTDGLPDIARWKDVKLVYLDPPYWKQAEGEYSDDKSDLANMTLEEFTNSLSGIINGFSKKLSKGACVALILQPTQWKAPEKQYTDHVADMIKAVKLPIDLRIQAPYGSQQCNAQMVEWAKENRKVLVLSREIVIWRV